MHTRFFSDDSFWNTPLPADAEADPKNGHYIDLLAAEPEPNPWLSLTNWTIPVYEVDERTPLRTMHRMKRGKWAGATQSHGMSFENPVPIPDHAVADPEADSHIAFVDHNRRIAWDMFLARKRDDGEWESLTAMKYSLDGHGVFDPAKLPAKPGESIHRYGPGRAAGVPIIAGLIMHDEVQAGRIDHKLAFACRVNGHMNYVWPAMSTDGHLEGGPPEGCVLQLDPTLDIDSLGLSDGARVVARALQEYGAVNVDVAGGTVIYAEGLYGHPDRSWEGLLKHDDLRSVDIRHFRILRCDNVQHGGKSFTPEEMQKRHYAVNHR